MKATKLVQIALFIALLLVVQGCVKNKGCKDESAINYSRKTKKADNSLCRYAKDAPTVIFDCDSYTYYGGNSGQVIHLTKIPNATIDYVFTCDAYISGTLLIDPGVTISFERNAGLFIQTGGKIVANGTANQPIIFTGGENKWKGINISSFGNNELRHVSIINGGYEREGAYPYIGMFNGDAALLFRSPDIGVFSVVMENVIVEKFGSVGIAIESSSNTGLNFSNIQLRNGNVPVHLKSMNNQSILASMTFSNNTNNYAQTNSVILSFSNTFQNYGIPYYVRRENNNANASFDIGAGLGLTLGAGVQLILGEGIGLRCGGSFTVQGSSTSPVTIRGTGATNWKDIALTGTGASGIHSINYCNISGAGYQRTAVIKCPDSGSGNIAFLNSTMSNVASTVTCGIRKNNSFNMSTTGSTFGTIPNVSCN
jgi:hypothetical protein